MGTSNPPPRPQPRKPITLNETPATPGDENEEVPLVGVTEMIEGHHVGGPSLKDVKSFELARPARPTHSGPRTAMKMQIVDWRQEKESFNLFLKTDKGVWIVAKAVSFVLGIRLLMTLLGANTDTRLSTFLHVMTEPLVAPFTRFTHSVDLNDHMTFETPAALAMACVLLGLGMSAAIIRKITGNVD